MNVAIIPFRYTGERERERERKRRGVETKVAI